jgi:hypothetical protein
MNNNFRGRGGRGGRPFFPWLNKTRPQFQNQKDSPIFTINNTSLDDGLL